MVRILLFLSLSNKTSEWLLGLEIKWWQITCAIVQLQRMFSRRFVICFFLLYSNTQTNTFMVSNITPLEWLSFTSILKSEGTVSAVQKWGYWYPCNKFSCVLLTCSVQWWVLRVQTALWFYVLVQWTQWTFRRCLADRVEASQWTGTDELCVIDHPVNTTTVTSHRSWPTTVA